MDFPPPLAGVSPRSHREQAAPDPRCQPVQLRVYPPAVRLAFGMAEMGSGVTYALTEGDASLRFHAVDRSSLGGALRMASW